MSKIFYEVAAFNYKNSSRAMTRGWNNQLSIMHLENVLNNYSGTLTTNQYGILIGKLFTIINS